MTKILCFIPHWLAHKEYVRVGRSVCVGTFVLGRLVRIGPVVRSMSVSVN